MVAYIHHRRIPYFRDSLREGLVYQISNFEVVSAYEKFQITDASNSIRFTDGTGVKVLSGDCPPIKTEFFQQLACGWADPNHPGAKPDRLYLHTKDCCLVKACRAPVQRTWGSQRPLLSAHLSTPNYSPVGFEGASMYPTIEEGKTFAKTYEYLTLLQLLAIVHSPDHQEIEFFCQSKVVDLNTRNGWNYVSCGRVDLEVSAEGAMTNFVFFDRDVRKLVNKTADEIMTEQATVRIDLPRALIEGHVVIGAEDLPIASVEQTLRK
ncbi:unnamed protein product [Cochlearia groenlandica]